MRQDRRRTWLLAALASAAMVAGRAEQGRADSYFTYLDNKTEDRTNSKFLIMANPKSATSIQRAEDELINSQWEEYLREQKLIAAVGQPSFNGLYPTAQYADGTSGILTFQFIDPTTGLPTAGPAVASVLYEVNDDPSVSGYTTLGVSTDAASNFSLPYTVTGFEPDVQAIPFDANGNPIFIAGFDGTNVALGSVVTGVPEPSALLLLGLGTVGMAGLARTRRDKARILRSDVRAGATCLGAVLGTSRRR